MTPDNDSIPPLPVHDVDPTRAELIRREAHVILRREHLEQSPTGSHWLSSVWYRFVEPSALVALGVGFLAWTVHGTVALFH
jgi:hypothetical protein